MVKTNTEFCNDPVGEFLSEHFMSRAFLKNETADDPVFIPPRAPLPPGMVNYVTPRGLQLLRDERHRLEVERARTQTEAPDETERTRRLAILNGRLADLSQRIATAKVVDASGDPAEGVRFGATVTLQTRSGKKQGSKRRLTLVGVDEADAPAGRVAFTAPIARALLGKRVGEEAILRLGGTEEVLTVVAVEYE